jgi:hypothetical protein
MAAVVKMRGARLAFALAAVACFLLAAASAQALDPPTFNTVKIAGKIGGGYPWTEPRIAVGPNGKYWAVTNTEDDSATAYVFGSADKGKTFTKAEAPLAGQVQPSPDVDIVVLPSGRIIASELDDAGVNFPTSYSDDGGKTWTASVGATQLADQDRQWFAYGPKDKTSGEYPVYLLYHNLASGQAQHNMFVSTSSDSGATFGPPVPITLPGEDAYSDLQCADSGGPSTIFVNQNDGTIYAEFTTRAAPSPAGDLGGCATAAAGQPLEFNIVAGTRVWLAQSTDGGITWTNSLAVDDAPTGQIVSMQVAYAGLDTDGRIYVAYPESPKGKQYPDYSGAGVKYKYAPPAKDGDFHWSDARTFAPADANAPGHVLVHMTIGEPGQLMAAYWTGEARSGTTPVWHMTAAVTNDGLAANPHVVEARISEIPTDVGDAKELMGACIDAGPVSGVISGAICDRSPDVWGVALDPQTCRTTIVWPAVDVRDNPKTADDDKTFAPGSDPGTFVSTQNGGPTLCGAHPGVKPGGGGGSASSCKDKVPPVSHFNRKRSVSRRKLHFSGKSHDKGCRGANGIVVAGKIGRVLVSVARVKGKTKHQRCAFLKSKTGTIGRFGNCRKPILLRARGTKKWSITLKPKGLPRGNYRVVVRAIDAAKNKERPRGASIAHFKVR